MINIADLTDLEKIKYILKGYLKDYIQSCSYYDIHPNESAQTIEIMIKKHEKEPSFLLLRMQLAPQHQEIYIHNIFLPVEDRGKGLGLGLIHVLFHVAKVMNCVLVLHSMVDGFYEAMLRRGAKETLLSDCLLVTDEMDLSQ